MAREDRRKDKLQDKLKRRKLTQRKKERRFRAARSLADSACREEVTKRVDITSLFNSFGVSLVAKGANYLGRCPWHADTHPSLAVNREQGLYHCFACGESGDVVSLVEKMQGCSFQEALDYLKKQENGREA